MQILFSLMDDNIMMSWIQYMYNRILYCNEDLYDMRCRSHLDTLKMD